MVEGGGAGLKGVGAEVVEGGGGRAEGGRGGGRRQEREAQAACGVRH